MLCWPRARRLSRRVPMKTAKFLIPDCARRRPRGRLRRRRRQRQPEERRRRRRRRHAHHKSDFDALIAQAKRSFAQQTPPRTFPEQGTTEFQTIKGQAVTLLVQQAEREEKATSEGIKITDKQIDDAPRPDQEAVLRRTARRSTRRSSKKQHLTDAQVRERHPRPADLGGRLQEGHERRQGRRRRGARLLHRAPAALLEGRRRATCATSSSSRRRSADSIYAQLKAGNTKTWCTLAKKYSQDPSSKDNCGKLTVSKGQTVAGVRQGRVLREDERDPRADPQRAVRLVRDRADLERAPALDDAREAGRGDDQAAAAAAEAEPGDDRLGQRPRRRASAAARRSSTRSASRRRPIRARRPRRRTPRPRLAPMSLADALVELQELTERLRRECPWDREQTARTIVPHTVEEAYEVADAALAGDDAKLLDEIGDLLFQSYFLALLLSERGARRPRGGRARRPRQARLAPSARLRRRRGAARPAACASAGRQIKRERRGARGHLPRRARRAARRCSTRARCSCARSRSASSTPTSPARSPTSTTSCASCATELPADDPAPETEPDRARRRRARRRPVRGGQRRAPAERRSGARAARRREAVSRRASSGAEALADGRRQGLDDAPARRAGRVLRPGKGAGA